MRKTAILWDLDGTLLDTLGDLSDAVNYVLRQYGMPERTLDEVRRFVGNGARRLMDQAVAGTTGEAAGEEIFQAFQTYYAHHCQIKTGPYPGILKALETLREMGCPMAVVSNKPDIAVKTLCGQYFPGIYARGESADCPRKPAPDMVYKAMEALGTERCIYVGDSEVDILTAKNAGVPCLSVLWGFRDRQTLTEAGANRFCERPEDLPEILTSMEKEYGE